MLSRRAVRLLTATVGTALAVGGLSGCLRQPEAAPPATAAGTRPEPTTAAISPTTPAMSPTSTPTTSVSTDPWRAITVPDGAWDRWRPVMTGVREASDADVRALQSRADALMLRGFSTTVETYFGPAEFAHRRDHGRLRFGDGSGGGLEVHVEALRPGEKAKGAFGLTGRAAVLCLDDECVRVTGDEDPDGRPHLFDNLTDSALFQLAMLEGSQQMAFDLFPGPTADGATVGTASVDSPLGALSCAVAAGSAAELRALEGQAVDVRSSAEVSSAVACVDARGLVVLTADGAFPVVAYHGFRPGVPDDLTEYPHPVKAYGT